MKTLEALIVENEDWLVDRVVHYAVIEGFAQNTSTLREAWRASICGLSGPILEAIAAVDAGDAAAEGFGQARDSIVAFGVRQAEQHRARGIRLADFIGLLKYYRRAYLDLIDENTVAPEDARRLRYYIFDFFDRLEIVLCKEWVAVPDERRLRDLQSKNRRLVNEKNKYLTIFETIHEPVILLDAEGGPVHLNDAAHRLFCGEVAPGASYYGALRSPLLAAQVAEILRKCATAGSDMVIETLAGTREFNVKLQRMLDVSRKFDGTVIILNDVSEYKRALSQARAADHAKSTFLAAMSHEIRTPIAGALGLARLLRDTPLEDDQRHIVDGIISSAELLAGVVGDILDFSQAEVGARPPVAEDFDLAGLVRQVLMVAEPLAGEKALELDTEIARDLPARLNGDASMIRQVLLNLTHNAIKFTDSGTVQIRVLPETDAASDAAEARIRFEVRDTGIGLPEGPTGRLFDPFSQGKCARGGLGLGLSICRKIVERMAGEIGCRPGASGGSVFFFILPLTPARAGAVAPVEPARGAPLRILVVDDDAVSRMVAEGVLARLGHATQSAAAATAALDMLARERFDLVLTDNRMPEISGLDLLERIRGGDGGVNPGIPVILVTASAEDMRSEATRRARPDGLLAKPYDAASLAQEITRVTGERPVVPPPPRPHETPAEWSVAEHHVAQLGRERGCRVIRTYLESAPRHVEAIRAGLDRLDRDTVANAAHSLAGASGLLGIAGVERLAREIEAQARSTDLPPGAVEISELRLRVSDACAALEQICASAEMAGQGATP
ncbi:ATP-binding protein [Tropicimonas sp. IMCC6043]|uniref:hybrid sensor histidine kinase/response regulator n=1 Tax=Tropicimonas sp. IMCC6043 TaxID=2510645 RepID=UPI00101BAC46|nr:ATP-binding protein [Tropicimonas sp. IMCC6043]RYH11605.1 PAS domain-containing sensor histidine kinase [Tropicimonas sp. IMCC6043]